MVYISRSSIKFQYEVGFKIDLTYDEKNEKSCNTITAVTKNNEFVFDNVLGFVFQNEHTSNNHFRYVYIYQPLLT